MHVHQAQGSQRSGKWHCQGRGQNEVKGPTSSGELCWGQGATEPGLVRAQPCLDKMPLWPAWPAVLPPPPLGTVSTKLVSAPFSGLGSSWGPSPCTSIPSWVCGCTHRSESGMPVSVCLLRKLCTYVSCVGLVWALCGPPSPLWVRAWDGRCRWGQAAPPQQGSSRVLAPKASDFMLTRSLGSWKSWPI